MLYEQLKILFRKLGESERNIDPADRRRGKSALDSKSPRTLDRTQDLLTERCWRLPKSIGTFGEKLAAIFKYLG
jgi:hypothetical protein